MQNPRACTVPQFTFSHPVKEKLKKPGCTCQRGKNVSRLDKAGLDHTDTEAIRPDLTRLGLIKLD